MHAIRFAASSCARRSRVFASTPARSFAAMTPNSKAEAIPTEKYDVVIVGGGPSGCALAGVLGAMEALDGARIALVDPGKLGDTMKWEPPADTYLNRTLQITASNKQYLESLGSWGMCYADRIQPYDRAVVMDAQGGGTIELTSPSTDTTAAYMVETKNLVSGLLKFVHKHGKGVDVIEKAKVTKIEGRLDSDSGLDWPTVTLSNKRRLQARLLVGTDGANSCVRRYAGIDTYGSSYDQYGLVTTLCLDQLNRTAFQRFLPTGPIAVLPFPGGFANLVWSLTSDHIQLLKLVPEGAFASLVNAAFRLSVAEMEQLYGMIREGASESQIKAETQWRLDVFARNSGDMEHQLPPTVVAISPKSRMSFPLRMCIVDRLVGERVALVGDAGHVVHPLAGQGLNMGLEDIQAFASILEQAAASGEDIGALSVLKRYSRQRYVRNLAMQGIIDKIWHTFGASASPAVKARSMLMNSLDQTPAIKNYIVKNAML
ncbi:ubiquinone biosynthesis hydrox [Martensiomyces pterosporus]|nr:ubiquinone biosynthesis hydrox [Martensiomyces pterosporus]